MVDNEKAENPLATKMNFAPAEKGATKMNIPAKETSKEAVVKETPAKEISTKESPVKETATEDTEEFIVDMTLDGTEKPAKEKKGKEAKETKEEPAKPNYSRFKEYVGKDPENEDEIEAAWKKDREELATYKTKASKLEILAQGSNKLKDDKDYQSWKNWLGAKPEDLVVTSIAYDYMEDGMSEAAAMEKAKARVDKEVEKNEEWIEDTARGIRKGLKASMAQREQQAAQEFENASKDISFVNPTADFEGKVKETWSKTEEFLGMKLSKDEKERTKLVSDAYIPPSKMNEQLKDPSVYQEVCLYLKYKKIWKANIEGRTNGKSKVLDRLPKTPSVGSGLTTRISNQPAQGAKGFDGKAFLGR